MRQLLIQRTPQFLLFRIQQTLQSVLPPVVVVEMLMRVVLMILEHAQHGAMKVAKHVKH
jgi:hypothetical protein